jgi:hypothetical protein
VILPIAVPFPKTTRYSCPNHSFGQAPQASERRDCVSQDRSERRTTLASVPRPVVRWWYGCGDSLVPLAGPNLRPIITVTGPRSDRRPCACAARSWDRAVSVGLWPVEGSRRPSSCSPSAAGTTGNPWSAGQRPRDSARRAMWILGPVGFLKTVSQYHVGLCFGGARRTVSQYCLRQRWPRSAGA